MLPPTAVQILEVETFIPMLLQNFDVVEGCRLKRVILIGDHHQLPPVVKNMAFQKYGNFDQSLFTRYVCHSCVPCACASALVLLL
jgi:intron-binding protein aquarius